LPAIIEFGLGDQFGGNMSPVVERLGEVVRKGSVLLGRICVSGVETAAEGAIRSPEIHGQSAANGACGGRGRVG